MRKEHICALEDYLKLKSDFGKLYLGQNTIKEISTEQLAEIARRLQELAPRINILEINHEAGWLSRMIYLVKCDAKIVPLVDVDAERKELELISLSELFPSGLPDKYRRYDRL